MHNGSTLTTCGVHCHLLSGCQGLGCSGILSLCGGGCVICSGCIMVPNFSPCHTMVVTIVPLIETWSGLD